MNKAQLKTDLLDTIVKYYAVFSEMETLEGGIRYSDFLLPNMYSHNFFYLNNDKLPLAKAVEKEEISFRKKKNQPVVQIDIYDIDKVAVQAYFDTDSLTEYEFLYAPIGELNIKDREIDATIKVATTEAEHEIGKEIDCLAFGEEERKFATARYERKQREYDAEKIYSFICFRENELIGRCDFFINGKIGRIEDFDVVEPYQRMGYGSAIIKAIRNFGLEKNVEILFLGVDKENSAREMYGKLGFEYIFNSVSYFKELEKGS